MEKAPKDETSLRMFWIVTDVLAQPGNPVPEARYVTGYWTGTGLSATMTDAKKYVSLEAAERDISALDVYDPVIHVVKIAEEGGAWEIVGFLDRVHKYGIYGNKE